MRTGPIKSFWFSFLLTMAVVMPVMGGFALYAALDPGAAPAEQLQSGVPVERPGPRQVFSLLAVAAGEEPAFVMLRLDPVEQVFGLVTVPSQTVVLSEGESLTLAQAYSQAGPARAARLLGQTLGIHFDRYLAAAPEVWAAAARSAGSARVNLEGVLTREQQQDLAAAEAVLTLTGTTAAQLLDQSPLEPPAQAALRGAVWQAFVRQNKDTLASGALESLKTNSGRLLTDVNALDFYYLAQSLEFLAPAEPEAQPLPGRWDRRTGRYELGPEALTLAEQLFGAKEEGEE